MNKNLINQAQQKLVPKLRFPKFVKQKSWSIKKLGGLALNLDSQRIPITGSERTRGDIPYYGASGIIDYIDDYIFDDYLLCISEDGANLVARTYPIAFPISGKAWINNHAHVLKFDNKKIQTIVENYLNSTSVEDYLTGMAQPKLNRAKLDTIRIPLSDIPEEQQKTADCFSSLDNLINAHNQKVQVLKDHKKGLVQKLFPAEGKVVPEKRFSEFDNEGGWNVSSIGAISSVASGGTPSRTENRYWDGDIPWVTTTLIDFNKIQKANEKITKAGLDNSSAKVFPEGTILMAMYGQGKTRGRVAVLEIEAAINQACASITLKKGMNKEFVFQNLAARYKEIREISNDGGQKNLSAKLIKEIPFSYPNIESKEQQKIADCLSSIDQKIMAQIENVEQLKQHKKGLMQQLFPNIDEVN